MQLFHNPVLKHRNINISLSCKFQVSFLFVKYYCALSHLCSIKECVMAPNSSAKTQGRKRVEFTKLTSRLLSDMFILKVLYGG